MDKNKRKFLQIHCHSIYSLRDGLSSIEDMFKVASKENEAFALTDHGSIAGWVEYYQNALKYGIKPVFGCEIYIHNNRDLLFSLLEKKEDLKKINSKSYLKKEFNSLSLSNEEKNSLYKRKKIISYELEEINKYYHLTVLVSNKVGFHNLIYLHNLGYKNFYKRPLIDKKELLSLPKDKDGTPGLIVCSGCLASESSSLILNEEYAACEDYFLLMKEIFKNNFFLELQAVNMPEVKRVNEKLIEFSRKLKIDLVIATDSHYLDDSYSSCHQDFLLLQGKQKISDVGKKQWHITYENEKGEIRKKRFELDSKFPSTDILVSELKENQIINISKNKFFKILKKKQVNKVWIIEADNLSFKPEKILREYVIKNHPELINVLEEAIENNKKIYSELIEDIKLNDELKLPRLENENRLLYQKVAEALKAFKLEQNKVYLERVKYELEIIIKNGYASYFLILHDLISYIKKEKIPLGIARGSSGGSLIAYLLGITRLDPIKYNLLFERFLTFEGKKEVIEIILENGEILILDKEANVKTNRGIIKAGELNENDEIIFENLDNT